MIRSSKHILKYQTNDKNNQLNQLFIDFKHDLNLCIDQILTGKLPLELKLTSKRLQFEKINHSQWKQIIYKQASEIIRSQIKKATTKRYNKYKQLYAKSITQGRRINFLNKKWKELNLNPIFRTKYFTCPEIKNLTITIDSRLINFSNDSKHFDEFVQILLPYFQENKKRAIKLNIPIKHHKHSLRFKD